MKIPTVQKWPVMTAKQTPWMHPCHRGTFAYLKGYI